MFGEDLMFGDDFIMRFFWLSSLSSVLLVSFCWLLFFFSRQKLLNIAFRQRSKRKSLCIRCVCPKTSFRKVRALRRKQGHPWRKNRPDVLVGKSGAIMYLPHSKHSKLWHPFQCLALGMLCLFTLSGCASRQLTDSFCGPLPADDAVTMIVNDASSTIIGMYPPGHTSIYLLPAHGKGSAFSERFENTLRSQGVTIIQDSQVGAVGIAYTLDELQQENAWYLQLRFSDGKAISRSYDAFGWPEAGQSRITTGNDSSLEGMAEKVGTTARNIWDAGANALQ